VAERIASSNLIEFFRERVREALDHQKVDAPEGVEYYLVNLLGDYNRVTPTKQQKPLAILLGEALKSGPHQRIPILKKIGDLSLFTAGFFPDSLRRRLVDVDYYIGMGGSAYGNLSSLMNREPAFEEIYTELASRFVSYVDILSEVSEKSELLSDRDILRIYETWLKTGSERAKQLLSDKGILPCPDVPLKTQ
jgi:hypothetical protein